MKKMICLMLALTCLFSMISMAFADGSSWPAISLTGYGTALKPSKDESRRYQSTFGPGKYPGAGAYKPCKVTSATALFREGDFVLVDLDYKTVGRRCLYFKSSALSNPNVEQVTLTPTTAVLTADVQPTFGPGYQYDGIDHDNKRIVLRQGTMVNVFFEADGWVFAEFGCQLGTIRGWIPMNMVSAY